jgi:uncharacterized membrane protein YjjB (DUF3815 family)
MNSVIVGNVLKIVASVKPLINRCPTCAKTFIFTDVKVLVPGISTYQIVIKVQSKFTT